MLPKTVLNASGKSHLGAGRGPCTEQAGNYERRALSTGKAQTQTSPRRRGSRETEPRTGAPGSRGKKQRQESQVKVPNRGSYVNFQFVFPFFVDSFVARRRDSRLGLGVA